MKPLVLIYANCQGLSVLHFLSCHPALKDCELLHLPAYEEARPPAGALERCQVFLYQTAFGVPDFLADLPPGARKLSFPAVSCSFLWPYGFDRPSEPVGWRFPYGDRFLAGKVKAGLSPEQAAQDYMAQDLSALMNLPRLMTFEFSKWDAIDRDHDVKIAGFMKDRILTQRLFFTPDHPTDFVLLELTNRILTALGLPVFNEPDWGSHVHTRGGVETPIHHSLIDALKLGFIARDHAYPLWGGSVLAGEAEVYRRYACALTRPSYDDALAEARESIQTGALGEALNICALIRLRDPGHPRALATLSVLHALLGQRQEAANLLGQAFA